MADEKKVYTLPVICYNCGWEDLAFEFPFGTTAWSYLIGEPCPNCGCTRNLRTVSSKDGAVRSNTAVNDNVMNAKVDELASCDAPYVQGSKQLRGKCDCRNMFHGTPVKSATKIDISEDGV